MRVPAKLALTSSVAVLTVGLALAQPPFQRGGGGADPAGLLRNPGVQKELKLTDEQVQKVPEAVLKALAEVLNPDQLKRLKQIQLQQRGSQAFTDAKVQEHLKMTDEQKDNIKTILSDAQKEMKDAFQGGDFKGAREKFTTLRKETMEKVTGTLTADQKKMWHEMIGEEFKMETPGFRQGGGGERKPGEFRKRQKKDAV